MNKTFNSSFHRTIVKSNLPIDGKYKYKNIFQIYNNSIDLGYCNSKAKNSFILEYSSEIYNNYQRIQSKVIEEEELFRHFDFRDELLALISLVSNSNLSTIDFPVGVDSKYTEYNCATFHKLDNINTILLDNEYILKKQNYFGDKFTLPEYADEFFEKYFKMRNEHFKRFKMSLFLYYNSIRIQGITQSMSYIALVSAIENLVDYEGQIEGFEPDICCACRQKKYKLTKRFKEMVERYCGLDIRKYNKTLNKIYDERSRIAHSGKLFYNDFAETELDYYSDDKLYTLKLITRIILVNWIMKNVS